MKSIFFEMVGLRWDIGTPVPATPATRSPHHHHPPPPKPALDDPPFIDYSTLLIFQRLFGWVRVIQRGSGEGTT